MSTLKELFDKHGSVWLTHKNFSYKKYFFPVGYSSDKKFIIGEWVCLTTSLRYKCEDTCFEIWEEPKPKVKRYQYKLIPEDKDYFPKIPTEFFKDENDLSRYYDLNQFTKVERLDSTMQEFDW